MKQPRLERIPDAASRMGVSTSQVYRELKAKRIGPLVRLGPRATALTTESIDNWINARIAEANART